jgi:hypothetical protein
VLPVFCVGVDTPEPCCDSLYTAADALLTVAYAALVECAGEELCSTVQSFVAAADPHLAMQDYVAVWYTEATLSPRSNRTDQLKTLLVQQPEVTFTVKVSESGYPTGEQVGTEIGEPSADELDWAGKHALGHAESVYRAVLDSVRGSHVCGTLKAIGPLRPIGPSGGVIGFAFAITTEIAWT